MRAIPELFSGCFAGDAAAFGKAQSAAVNHCNSPFRCSVAVLLISSGTTAFDLVPQNDIAHWGLKECSVRCVAAHSRQRDWHAQVSAPTLRLHKSQPMIQPCGDQAKYLMHMGRMQTVLFRWYNLLSISSKGSFHIMSAIGEGVDLPVTGCLGGLAICCAGTLLAALQLPRAARIRGGSAAPQACSYS